MIPQDGRAERSPASEGSPSEDISLTLVSAGQEVILTRIRGGRGMLHRLAEMGLSRGSRFRVLSKGFAGPLIVVIKGTRFVIGKGMANRIFVRPPQKGEIS